MSFFRGTPRPQLGSIRVKGTERFLAPVGRTWKSFFLRQQKVTDDFMEERDKQERNIYEKQEDTDS